MIFNSECTRNSLTTGLTGERSQSTSTSPSCIWGTPGEGRDTNGRHGIKEQIGREARRENGKIGGDGKRIRLIPVLYSTFSIVVNKLVRFVKFLC